MITISGTDASASYHIQRILLSNASPWFEKALSERFKEGQECVLRLSETDDETISLFLYWLIHGKVALPASDTMKRDEEGGLPLHSAQRSAVRLWVFGDQHFLPQLQKDAMDYLKTVLDIVFPSISLIEEVYHCTPAGSPLRHRFVGEFAAGWHNKRTPLDEQKAEHWMACAGCGVTALHAVETHCCWARLCGSCIDGMAETSTCGACNNQSFRLELCGVPDGLYARLGAFMEKRQDRVEGEQPPARTGYTSQEFGQLCAVPDFGADFAKIIAFYVKEMPSHSDNFVKHPFVSRLRLQKYSAEPAAAWSAS